MNKNIILFAYLLLLVSNSWCSQKKKIMPIPSHLTIEQINQFPEASYSPGIVKHPANRYELIIFKTYTAKTATGIIKGIIKKAQQATVWANDEINVLDKKDLQKYATNMNIEAGNAKKRADQACLDASSASLRQKCISSLVLSIKLEATKGINEFRRITIAQDLPPQIKKA